MTIAPDGTPWGAYFHACDNACDPRDVSFRGEPRAMAGSLSGIDLS